MLSSFNNGAHHNDEQAPTTTSSSPQVDGLGDRQRSLSPEDNWDTLLTTITPDQQLPSADSSFTSASAASLPLSHPMTASTSLTAPEGENQEEGMEDRDSTPLSQVTSAELDRRAEQDPRAVELERFRRRIFHIDSPLDSSTSDRPSTTATSTTTASSGRRRMRTRPATHGEVVAAMRRRNNNNSSRNDTPRTDPAITHPRRELSRLAAQAFREHNRLPQSLGGGPVRQPSQRRSRASGGPSTQPSQQPSQALSEEPSSVDPIGEQTRAIAEAAAARQRRRLRRRLEQEEEADRESLPHRSPAAPPTQQQTPPDTQTQSPMETPFQANTPFYSPIVPHVQSFDTLDAGAYRLGTGPRTGEGEENGIQARNGNEAGSPPRQTDEGRRQRETTLRDLVLQVRHEFGEMNREFTEMRNLLLQQQQPRQEVQDTNRNNELIDLRNLLSRMVQREDIPDEFWAEVGLRRMVSSISRSIDLA